jgi:acetyltransferase-like isoleucine patch superfamily enzyme
MWWKQQALRAANAITPWTEDSRLWEVKNAALRRLGTEVGPHSAIGPGFWCLDPTQIAIGREVALGVNVRLHNFNRIVIGDLATIAADTSAVNGWHSTRDLAPASGEMRIGRGVWIGLAARLVGPITLGDNCIVGAGSVVVHDVAPGAIVAGSPARVIGQRDLADRQWHFRGRWWDTKSFEVLTDPIASPPHKRP